MKSSNKKSWLYKKVIKRFLTKNRQVFTISVLRFFSTIFGKIIASRLTNYSDKYNIINKNQFGFRKNCSTFMAVINMLEKSY